MNKVNVYGGLGNQMFQFAFSYILKKRGVLNRISLQHFFTYNHHNGFELDRAFEIEFTLSEKLKIFFLKNGSFIWQSRGSRFLLTRVFHLYSLLFERVFKEDSEYHYNPRVYQIENSRLVGTWQSVKYLEGYESVIRDVFKFRSPIDSVNMNLSKDIISNNSIAVHIRRGDYLNAEWKSTHLVIDGPKFYADAIDKFSKKLLNPIFYFFSDDLDWVKENFEAPNFVYVENNSFDQSYLDMYLMSLCSNFIISNSTFSWWGAWLSTSPNKEVICPSPWIKGRDIQEIYPDNWLVFEV